MSPFTQHGRALQHDHNDGKLPILDLTCSMDNEGIIRFKHYEKPTANKSVLSAKSALPLDKSGISISMYVYDGSGTVHQRCHGRKRGNFSKTML